MPCSADALHGMLRYDRPMTFSAEENFARELDAEDPLRRFREKFHLPLGKNGEPLIYFAGNSLGLMPKSARTIVEQELDDWAATRVDAHLEGKTPWYSYHETVREPAARLVGAQPNEVICMNSLTVNLHLMMATFYRPTKSRRKILMEEPAFPSDTYAIKTQIVHHGFDPNEALILARPRDGELTVRQEDIEAAIEETCAMRLPLMRTCWSEFFHRPVVRHRENHSRRRRSTASSLGSISRTRSATCRWRCTIGMSISRSGVPTNISTPDPARSRARSCTSGTPQIQNCRGSPAGSGTIRTLVSACSSSRSSFPCRRPTDGRSVTRRFFPWRHCAHRSPIFDEAGGMEPLRAKSIKLTGYLEFLLQRAGSRPLHHHHAARSLTSAVVSYRFSSTIIRRSSSRNSKPPA